MTFEAPSAAQGEPWPLLSAFLDETPDFALVLTTPEGVVLAWLGAAERVTGYAPSEAIGQPLSLIFTPEDRERGLDTHEIGVARAQGRSEDDRWHLRKNGSRFWASGVLTAVHDGAGEVVALCKLLRDKTDVRTQLQRLAERVATREAEIARRQDANVTTAHELRNPLMAMASALALLERTTDPATVSTVSRVLRNQVGVLTAIVDDLANGHADRDAASALDLQPVDLHAALQVAVDAFRPRAAAESKTLMLLLPSVDIWIRADPARLQQMLLNLLGNAFKYTRPGGRIGVSASIEADMAIVRIEDDGRGMAADVLPHVFELFIREERDDGIDGLGVGLSVVKDLAERHGGNVEARSPGQDMGSVFGLRLPLHAHAAGG